MRNIIVTLFIFLIVFGSATSVGAATAQPEVHAILFWTNGCPNCSQVITSVLPPIQDKYSTQLDILMVEVVSAADIDRLYEIGTALELSKEQVSVPFLLINHAALIGVDEIRDKLPNLIEEHLSAGGLDYPDLPQLERLLPKGISFSAFDANGLLVPQEATNTKATGMALAWVIMVLMVIALILSIVMIVRAIQGKPIRITGRWLELAIPILSIIGLGVSIYLTYVEFTHVQALCGPVGDCNAVQSSPYAKLFGVVPIGLVGAIGYIAILCAWFWRHYRTDSVAGIAGPAMFGMAFFGILFSIYLTYLELFVILAVCIWCLTSAVIITALMLLNLPSITQWLAITDEEE